VEESWVLNPGDMLYLPPRVGHNGVAETDGCVTYSIGYRAAQSGDMLMHFAAFCAAQLKDEDRYADPDLSLRSSSGEICQSDLERVTSRFRAFVDDPQQLARWFGRFVTEPKYPEQEDMAALDQQDDGLLAALFEQADGCLRRGEGIRFAYCQSGDKVQLFVHGHSFDCPLEMSPLLQLLCDQNELKAAELTSWAEHEDGVALLEKLLASDYLYLV